MKKKEWGIEEGVGLVRGFFPFGEGKMELKESVSWELEGNVVKAIERIGKERAFSIEMKCFMSFWQGKNREKGFFDDFNVNWSFFITAGLVKRLCGGNCEENEEIRRFLGLAEKWLFELFCKSEKTPFFQIDLLEEEKTEFFVKCLVGDRGLKVFLTKKERKHMVFLVKSLFYELVMYNFFTKSTDFSKKIGFFALKEEGKSFKNSFFFKGIMLEVNSSNFYINSEHKNAKFTVILSVEDFSEKHLNEFPLKKGFDEEFFTTGWFCELTGGFCEKDAVFFQRKIPQKIEILLRKKGVSFVDGLGEKNMQKLVSFLGISPAFIGGLGEREKREIGKFRILENFEEKRRFLIVDEGFFGGEMEYFVVFYLERKNIVEKKLREIVPGILNALFLAMDGEEFLVENGGFEHFLINYLGEKTQELIKTETNRKKISYILKAFTNFSSCLKEAIIECNHDFDSKLNKIFENFFSYPYSPDLFKNEQFERKIENPENFFLRNKKVHFNLKMKKYESLVLGLKILKEFIFFHFI